ncbi:ATP-binding protein [Aurantiacibacter spongiae]|uniref:histidine kinase n=1 Tax=Aurantiacibacter spongiae TaxID=2488860 RepID=A0A3N5CXS2_9SPHN|nr:HAMP domain-containing histidine kinase [Aurantiacibacter spongiae]RPF72420.1 sensor histidine kinase [Aurantiacibacter spongiae]
MQFDDRLATVLRMRTDSDAAARTQFRQLVDLMGTTRLPPTGAMTSAAYIVLGLLQRAIPEEDQSRILREPGTRLRVPRFVALLAEGPSKPAAAAMATARLREDEWLRLIPSLPVIARGFLRHRRDLPQSARQLLARLGVGDLVLTGAVAGALPAADGAQLPAPAPAPTPPASPQDTASPAADERTDAPAARQSQVESVGALLRRIEAFREERSGRSSLPEPLPARGRDRARTDAASDRFDFTTGADGAVIWADEDIAPLAVGLMLTAPTAGDLVRVSDRTRAALAHRQPLRAAPVTLAAAPAISGEWRMEATPVFEQATGGFAGYHGRLYRPLLLPANDEDSPADAMRQVLHELRTPVNALQGFAEIIQQQLFGAVPHEYRAHAAAISVDAAKLLAGFDEVDRLVKLEAGGMALEDGETDLRTALVETIRRLEGVLRPRNAGFALDVAGSPFAVALDRSDAMVLCWRLLATAAGAMGPGETIPAELRGDGQTITLKMEVPRSLLGEDGAPAAAPGQRRVVSAGMFGPGFAFRLAQAEARAAGGTLACEDEQVVLTLPALTAGDAGHSRTAG